MTMIGSTAPVAQRGYLLTAPRVSLTRNELLAGLYILGCGNGLGSRMIDSVRSDGWTDALMSTFGISAIVWVACFAGVRLILRGEADEIRPLDVALGAGLLVPVALPIGSLSWLAVTILSLYVILFASHAPSSRRRGAVILLAATVPMLWSRLLFRYFANFILEIDASLVGRLMGTHNTGNIVPFADQSGNLVIMPLCSSLANVSLAVLTWVTVSQLAARRWSAWDLFWCFLAAACVVAVNVTRMSFMALSQSYYDAIHGPLAATIVNLVILGLMVGICMFGARRDVFSRA